jgi:hypothetical protein
MVLVRFGIAGRRSWMLGGKMGSSGCLIVECRRRDTRRACGRVDR